jgi:cyclophilin family peptidyl-prolyl cis-trans isomerase
MSVRKVIIMLALVVAAIVAASCGSSSKASVGGRPSATGGSTASAATTTATIETNMGTIVIELDTAHAPKAAGRFIELAKKGFYNGLTFHRVVPDFVIQGGDPKGDGTGGTGTSVVGEVPTDGYPIGSVAAAKTGADPAGTFDCQFFIVTGQQGMQLPPDYARFGKVIAGMDVTQKIEKLAPPEGDGPPTQKVVMKKVTISTT